jgi:hypothetical protein
LFAAPIKATLPKGSIVYPPERKALRGDRRDVHAAALI